MMPLHLHAISWAVHANAKRSNITKDAICENVFLFLMVYLLQGFDNTRIVWKIPLLNYIFLLFILMSIIFPAVCTFSSIQLYSNSDICLQYAESILLCGRFPISCQVKMADYIWLHITVDKTFCNSKCSQIRCVPYKSLYCHLAMHTLMYFCSHYQQLCYILKPVRNCNNRISSFPPCRNIWCTYPSCD